MKHQRIAVVCLLLGGSAALLALHYSEVTTEITPRPILYLVSDAQRELERIPLALTRVSVEEENRIGEELAGQFGFVARESTPEAKRRGDYLAEVGERLAANVKRKGIRYRFHYLDTSLGNAFAMPGGQVFFGRGLFELLESEDELAAIIGHEIAHVDQRHAIERLQYELKSRKLGLRGFYRLGQLVVGLFQAGYTKGKELEADRAGLGLAVAAGYSPAGALDVMRKFARLHPDAKRRPNSPLEEAASIPLQSLFEYFRSHPPPAERLAALEKEIAARGWDLSQPQRPLGAAKLSGATLLP